MCKFDIQCDDLLYICKYNLKKENEVRILTTTDFKTHYKYTVFKQCGIAMNIGK